MPTVTSLPGSELALTSGKPSSKPRTGPDQVGYWNRSMACTLREHDRSVRPSQDASKPDPGWTSVDRPALHLVGPCPTRCRATQSVESVEGGAEGEDAPVRADQPIAAGGVVGGHPHNGCGQGKAPGRTVEGGVTVGEDASVGGYEPVAEPTARARHAVDRPVEHDAAGGPEERCTEGEDAAVRGHQPVAPIGIGTDADHWLVQRLSTHRTEEGRVSEGEDPSVGGHQPVALAGRRGGDVDDRGVQVHGSCGSVEARI